MAKITFVQTISQPFLGLYYLCGALRHSRHDYQIIVSNTLSEILSKIKQIGPDLLGFTMYSGYHVQCLEIIRQVKSQFDIPCIVGGPHPTFFPDVILSEGVDIICRGEGELALVDLMNRIDQGLSYLDVQNLTINSPNGVVISNDVRDLIDPLDSLPMPDFSIYQNFPLIMNHIQPMISAVRGCPYSCTYCYNDGYRKLYKNKGRYVRFSSPRRVVAEITEFLNTLPHAKVVDFPGDCFGLDDEWLEELMILYRKEIGLPFSCLYRPEMITEKKASLLAQGRCLFVAFGIESGSERIRKEILKRNYSNATVIRAAEILRQYGIKYRTYNMIGLPTENIDELWQTIELNIKIKADMPWCSIYTPYPGTKLSEFCIELGLVPPDYNTNMLPTNFHLDSILSISQKNQVINLHHLFQSIVLFPKLMPLWKILMKSHAKKLIEIWFKVIFLYCRIKSDRPRNLLKYVYSMAKSRD